MSDAANSGSSEEASKDGASSSEQSSGAANEKGREERRAADRANHAADAKRSRYFTKLMDTVAKAHECDVSLAVTAFSNSRPNSNIREAVVGLAGTQRSKVMPHLAKIRRVMAATVKACVRDLAQQASEPALQPQKQRKGHKKGPLRTRLGRGEGPSADQQPKTRLAMLSCCAGHRLLALQNGLWRLPATQQDLCSKVSHILLRKLHAPIARHSCTLVPSCC